MLLTLLYKSHAEHIGSCLSCMDILSETLMHQMRPKDKFILSKGHAAPALYVVLFFLGKINQKTLFTFRRDKTTLPAHPPPNLDAIIPFHSGSLGHGLSLSCGIAEAMRLLARNKKNIPRVFCLISDGECNEGQVWEAAQYATARKLQNIVILIDKNRLQAFGETRDVLGDAASVQKWKAFEFETYVCNGHNEAELKKAFQKIYTSKLPKPKVIICNTIKGHGISFMENQLAWHYHHLDETLYQKAIKEIQKHYET